MGLKYLLDSNVLSEPPKPRPHAGVLGHLGKHGGEVATAAVVFHEMLHGMLRLPASRRRKELEEYLEGLAQRMPILPYDEDAALWHAEERARLYKKTPAFVDGQIAAVAAVNGLIPVTANVKHFAPFRIKVENWARP